MLFPPVRAAAIAVAVLCACRAPDKITNSDRDTRVGVANLALRLQRVTTTTAQRDDISDADHAWLHAEGLGAVDTVVALGATGATDFRLEVPVEGETDSISIVVELRVGVV